MKTTIALSVVCLFLISLSFSQTNTTGEISGLVTDQSSAVISRADVTIVNKDTGTQRSTNTNAEGYYRAPLLPPGNYSVTVVVPAFRTFTRDNVFVDVNHSVHLDFQMSVGSVDTKVDVTSLAPILEPANPNTTTTYNSQQLDDVPNPGMDLSHVAVVAPGAIMNVVSSNTFSSGNVEFNGLPSIANDFTIDGLDANDSWENTNRTGATGLQLGLSSIQEVSINTEAYGADQGRFGASQINYVTKSGTNAYHGGLWEVWNGSALNSMNYFIKANGGKKPFSNVNQFGGSFGGHIIRNKLFFFGSVEGIRIVVPSVLSSTLPTPAYQSYVLQQLTTGGFDPVSGMNLPAQPAEIPYYQTLFSLMGDTSRGTSVGPVPGCPFDVGGGTPARPGAGNGCANVRRFSVSPPASETLYTAKVDYNFNGKNTMWFRTQIDNGHAIANPSAVNSIFNVGADFPQRSVVAGWTHTFTPQLINEFNPGFSFWSRVHQVADPKGATVLPLTLTATPFTTVGVGQNIYGDAVRAWQINDNLSWTHGRHGFKFGTNTRRTRYSDFETVGYAVIPFMYTFSLQEFTYGAAALSYQAFPTYSIDHLQSVSMDNYAMDTIKVNDKLTVTVGLRVAWNSNPISKEGVLSRLKGTWDSLSHDSNQPLNQVILAHQSHLFADTYPITWQPRAAIAYSLNSRTVVRAGGGLFANPLLGFLPSYADENVPSDNFFQAGIFGPVGGIGIFPGSTSSVFDAAVAANRAFQSGFANGVVSCSANNPPANCLPPITFTTFDSTKQKFPSIMQWSLAAERQFGNDWGLTLQYVGTRSTHGFYSDSPNAYQLFCNGCFPGYKFGQPADGRFGNIFPFKTGTNSSYHGLQASLLKRFGHGLLFQGNYTYSHCIDEVTNGGVEVFNYNENFGTYNGRLGRLRSNCDFDFRHSFNGSYLYQLPFRAANGVLNAIVGGWQVSGTVFARDGLPFSVFSASAGGFVNGSPPLFANVVPGVNPYTTKTLSTTTPGTIQWLNPTAFQSVIDPTTGGCFPSNTPQNCRDGDSGRNNYRTPRFFWSDFAITKRFKLTEAFALKFDTQFFNVFNHPNFGLPNGAFGAGNANAGIPSNPGTLTGIGTISNTVGPNTGLLGGGLGGDTSVRMIALRASLEF
jgi:hypothetical protein